MAKPRTVIARDAQPAPKERKAPPEKPTKQVVAGPPPAVLRKPEADGKSGPVVRSHTELAREEMGGIWAGVTVTFELLPLIALVPHPQVQRKRDEKRLSKLRKNWNAFAVHDLSCVRRGALNEVFDGAHRLEVLKDKHTDHQHVGVVCQVFHGVKATATEAELQLLLGDVRGWHTIDRFNMRLLAGDAIAKSLVKVLSGYDCKIDYSPGPRAYSCVAQLEYVMTLEEGKMPGANILALVIDVIETSWPLTSRAREGNLVRALGYLFYSFGNDIDRDRLMEILARMEPVQLIRVGRGRSETRRTATPVGVASEIRDLYNVGDKFHMPLTAKSRRPKLGLITTPKGIKAGE